MLRGGPGASNIIIPCWAIPSTHQFSAEITREEETQLPREERPSWDGSAGAQPGGCMGKNRETRSKDGRIVQKKRDLA